MSSTYAHYQGPASLPSRYAILSRFSGQDPDGDQVQDSSPEDDLLPPRPRHPVIGTYPRVDNPPKLSESTPLLLNQQPPLPLIEEQIDRDASRDQESMFSMIREEASILTKYALPVFA